MYLVLPSLPIRKPQSPVATEELAAFFQEEFRDNVFCKNQEVMGFRGGRRLMLRW